MVVLLAVVALYAAKFIRMALSSEYQCRSVSEEFVRHLNSGDVDAAAKLMDGQAFLESGISRLSAPSEFRERLVQLVAERSRQENFAHKFASRLIQNTTNDGQYRLLRVESVPGQHRALVRYWQKGAVFNYFQFVLERRSAGYRIVDVHNYTSGERGSETMYRTLLGIAAKLEPSEQVVSQMSPSDRAVMRHIQFLQELSTAHRAADHVRVLQLCETAPPELLRDKTVLFYRVISASQVDESTLARAVQDYERQFPSDPALNMLRIIRCLAKEQFAEALQCLDRLESDIGQDPYLNYLRSRWWFELQDRTKAREFGQKAIDEEPDLMEAYWGMIAISLADRDFDATARWLTTVVETFSIPVKDLTTQPLYAEFVRSPEYRRWLEKTQGGGR